MEEYESQDGTLKTNNKLREFRSIDKVDNVKIPKVKKLDNTYVDHEEYMKKSNANEEEKLRDLFGEAVTDTDVDLPF